MGAVVDGAATAALGLGLLLATIGLYGLLRMPEVFAQLHAAGLITGPAVVLVLLASVATGNPEVITSAVLVAAFVLVTSPLSAHAIGQAERRRERPSEGEDDRATSERRRVERSAGG